MNPNDLFQWSKTYFERKSDDATAPGLPGDRKKTTTTPAKPASGGTIVPSMIQGSLYDSILREMNRSLTMNFTYTTGAAAPDVKFSGKEFAAGTAKGARSFRVDPLGRLTGIHYKQVWLPGENVSECRAEQGAHAPGQFPNCKCGFYGYYDGSNDYYTSGYVSAVVEGYGEAVMGDKGFRVTKARIVALSIDDTVAARDAHLVRRNYASLPQFDSFSRMVAEYPTDFELDSKIPSPDEDDFWTRNA